MSPSGHVWKIWRTFLKVSHLARTGWQTLKKNNIMSLPVWSHKDSVLNDKYLMFKEQVISEIIKPQYKEPCFYLWCHIRSVLILMTLSELMFENETLLWESAFNTDRWIWTFYRKAWQWLLTFGDSDTDSIEALLILLAVPAFYFSLLLRS